MFDTIAGSPVEFMAGIFFVLTFTSIGIGTAFDSFVSLVDSRPSGRIYRAEDLRTGVSVRPILRYAETRDATGRVTRKDRVA